MASTVPVVPLIAAAIERLPGIEVTAHFHNTRGAGLANVLAALETGLASFESSFGELGGCPVPPGATGNIATEDLVSMLHEMGLETGVDLDALIACARSPGTVVDRDITSSGRGDTEPVDKNKTPAAFERNRRVDVLWKVIPGLHVEKRTPLTSNVDAAPPASSANSLTVRY
mgnify:CR=1 FL=1